jgi:predicted TIM-barrel enzyme
MKNFKKIFKNDKPVIAMIHLPALPGSPLYDPKLGLNYIIESAQRDLEALQDADVDAVSKKNVLGKTNIEVSVIGFGEAPFGY